MFSLMLGCSAFFVSVCLTPLCRDLFVRWGLVDLPDGGRKLHRRPIPRLGGVPVVLAFISANAILTLTGHFAPGGMLEVWRLIPAAGLVFFTGLLDDLYGLKPWLKLLGQFGGAALAYSGGIQISRIAGYSTHNWWGCALTLLWLVGCANAFNLIDGVDGLASGVGLFAAVTMLLAGLLEHNVPLVLASTALAGALLGFLRYNFSPASIFLGDSGSLFIGFVLGCYGIIWSQKSTTLLGITAPMMALAIPLLDTLLAIIRRFLRRQPIFGADRNHIHHRLLERGLTPRGVTLVLYGVCGIAAACSLLQSFAHGRYSGLVIIVFCAAMWLGVQQLGYTEFRTARRLLMAGTFQRIVDTEVSIERFQTALAKAQTLKERWEVVRSASGHFGLAHVRLRLNGDTFEERIKSTNGHLCWTIRIPLSGTEYIDLTHDGAPIIGLTPLANMLQRCLSAQVSPSVNEVSRTVSMRSPHNNGVSSVLHSAQASTAVGQA
jgi:UDP-GlcNAc:undecaprenyl-phosphate GlcNAc-1-phosphate transferase